jgi:hypothetical protein
MRIGKMICVRKKAKKDNSFSVSFCVCDPLTSNQEVGGRK